MKKGERKQAPERDHKMYAQVYQALTPSEVAAGWHKHIRTVYLAVNTNRLVARKAKGTYLISYRSVLKLWGKPLEAPISDPVY